MNAHSGKTALSKANKNQDVISEYDPRCQEEQCPMKT
jgi:hypothetical protein